MNRRGAGATAAALLVMAAVVGIGFWLQRRQLTAELLRTEPARILNDTRLLRDAARIAQPLYQRHCASCHGMNLEGSLRHGVPNLARNVWLYGDDPIGVEHTILYGIRSGHPKARNVTDMPAMVRSGQLTRDDAHDVVEYLQKLAGNRYEPAAALRGRSIYYDKGNCHDCHARDAKGVPDYGTPALTGPVYLYGGDRDSLYTSVVDGRHGECPAWINVLTPLQIRALALYLVSAPRRP